MLRIRAFWQKRNGLQKALIWSSLGHILFLIFILFEMPFSRRESLELGTPIAMVFETPSLESPKPEAPPPPKPIEPPPQPPPKPAPAPETVAEPVPLPEPKKEPKPEPKPAPKPEPKPKAPPKARPVTKATPQPKLDFKDTLKDLKRELAKAEPPKPEPEATRKPNQDLAAAVKAELTKPQSALASQGLQDTEMARVREQLMRCWSPPVGAKEAHLMAVDLAVDVGPDRVVTGVEILRRSPETTNQFAESTVRAVNICQKLDLPEGKYEIWKRIIFTFTPKDLL